MLGDAGGRAFDARVEEHEPGIEFADAIGRHDDRPDRNLAAGQEADVVQPAVGRGHLVLRADGLVEQFLLDMDALGGQLVLADHPSFERMQGVQQPHGKGRTGPHAAAGRQVAVVVDFHAASNLQVFQCLADGGVRDLVDRMAILDLRVDHAGCGVRRRAAGSGRSSSSTCRSSWRSPPRRGSDTTADNRFPRPEKKCETASV